MGAAKAISEDQPMTVRSRGCLFVFGLIFFAAGAAFLWMIVLHPLIRSFQAGSWETTQATITHSEVEVHRDSDGDTYKPDIHFEFTAQGQPWTSTEYSFNVGSTGGRGWVDRAVQKYRVGSKHECFYNPNDPSDAVLERNFPMSNLFGLFTLLFVGIGGGIMFYALFGKNKIRTSISGEAATGTRSSADDLHQADSLPWNGSEGPQKLKPVVGRYAALIGIGAVGLIWNTISWIGFIAVWNKNGGWGVGTIFLSVFVVIGMLLAIAVVYQLLASFNPVVEIALSNGAIPAGESVDIAWEGTGNMGRVSELSIQIIGRETAIYTRGTSTYTDHNVFLTLPVISSKDPAEMNFGSSEFQLPLNAIPSFDARRNKIEWSIEIKGVIRFWPDIKESYRFFVKPANGTGETQ